MTYKQFTVRAVHEQMSHQWVGRALTRDLALADRRNLGDLVLRYLPHDGPILEAGCGIGGWVKWLSLHGYDVVGVDWYDDVVEAARQADPSLVIERGDITRLRWPDHSFAGYVSLGVIDQRLTAMMIVMAVVTTVAATPLFRWLYNDADQVATGGAIKVDDRVLLRIGSD